MLRACLLILALVLIAAATTFIIQSRSVSVRATTLDGKTVDPFEDDAAAAAMFIFVRSDCPIANRYAPEIGRLHTAFKDRDVRFTLVYPDRDETPATIRKHMKDYGYTCDALIDTYHDLVRLTEARVTPEAAVFDSRDSMTYCGRIDDWYVDFGTARPAPTTRDLQDALLATLEHRPVVQRRVPGVGCYIVDLQ